MAAIKIVHGGRTYITNSWTFEENEEKRSCFHFMAQNEYAGPDHQNLAPMFVILDLPADDFVDILVKCSGKPIIDLTNIQ